MTQWFRGTIEGFFMGQLDRALALGGVASGRAYRLLVYRALIRDVELLDWRPEPGTTQTATLLDPAANEAEVSASAAAGVASEALSIDLEPRSSPKPDIKSDAVKSVKAEETPPLTLPPWLPEPGTAFFQPTITDARLFPLRHTAGWYEGPVHQVFIEGFKATHTKQHGKRVYGRFVGTVQAYFAMPDAPRPIAAERIIQAFQEVPEDENPPPLKSDTQRASLQGADLLAANLKELESSGGGTASSVLKPLPSGTRQNSESTAHPPSGETKTPANNSAEVRPTPGTERRGVPFLILVLLVAAGLLLSCGAGRALIWLMFLLPTLLVRRILRGTLAESTPVAGFSALLSLGQVWLTGMVFVGWWESPCRDMHALPLVGTLAGLAIACILPSDIPLLVNMSSLAGMLFGWCSARGEECDPVGRSVFSITPMVWQHGAVEVCIEESNRKGYPPPEFAEEGFRGCDPNASGVGSILEHVEAHRS